MPVLLSLFFIFSLNGESQGDSFQNPPLEPFERFHLLKKDVSLSQRAIVAKYHLNRSSITTEASLRLMNSAFQIHSKKELLNLSNSGLTTDISFKGGVLRFTVSGSKEKTEETFQWLLQKYFSFTPSQEELSTAMALAEESLSQEENQTLPSLVLKEGFPVLSPGFHFEKDILKQQQKLNSRLLMDTFRSIHQGGTLTLVLAGDFTEKEGIQTAQILKTHLPKLLVPPEHRDAAISEKLNFFSKKRKKAPGYGFAMFYDGPYMAENLVEVAALKVLVQIFNEKIARLQTVESQARHVHSAYFFPFLSHWRFAFAGQGENKEDVSFMKYNWKIFIENLRKKNLATTYFQPAKEKALAEERNIPQELSLWTQEMADHIDSVGMDIREKIIKLIPLLSAEEIQQVGNKYLYFSKSLTVLHAQHPLPTSSCELWLTSAMQAQRELKNPSY